MIVIDLQRAFAETTGDRDPLVWQINLVRVTHDYFDLMEQLPQGIYNVCDFEIARCDLVKHRSEQEEVIAANKVNLKPALSCQQFLKMNSGINPAEAAAQNDDSFFASVIGCAIDHRVDSVATLR